MNTIKYILIYMFSSVLFLACNNETDDPMPVVMESTDVDAIKFLNTFDASYTLSDETKTETAVVLQWEKPDYGVDTNVNYEIEGSINMDFESITVLGSPSDTTFIISVDDLLGFSDDLGIDNDPSTTNTDGTANNTGTLYIRVKAFLGSATPTNVTYTPSQPISILLTEQEVCDSLFLLGDAVVDVAWDFSKAITIDCENDVLDVKTRLTNGTFRFFTTIDDWDSVIGYSDYADYTLDSRLTDADDGNNNFRFTGDDGIYTLRIDKVTKEISLTASGSLWAVGEAVSGGWDFTETTAVELVESAPDIWSASIELAAGQFRFFSTFNTWDRNNNYSSYEDNGYTIDTNFENKNDDADNNFVFVGTPGTYTLTIDANNKTITISLIEEQGTEEMALAEGSLWAAGDAVPGGWDFVTGTTVEFVEATPNVWSASIELSVNTFRFFLQFDWGSSYNYPYFKDKGYTIDSNFEDQNDGVDNNFNFIGTPGTYTLTIDANNKTITLE